MISVITISFNQLTYLEHCIDSIFSQSDQDYEHIIVDAGSNDGSRELIASRKECFSHIIFEGDKGPADGLNKGFSFARGDIYCFINSDDMLEPDSIAIIHRYFYQNPDVDVVSGHSFIRSSSGRIKRIMYSDRYNLFHAGMNTSIISQQSTFFRSHVMLEKGVHFNVNNKIAWDYEFFLDCYLAGAKFGLIPKVLSSYRVYPGTVTSSPNLHLKMKQYEDDAFLKVYPTFLFRFRFIMKPLFVLARKIFNLRDTIERVRKGSIVC